MVTDFVSVSGIHFINNVIVAVTRASQVLCLCRNFRPDWTNEKVFIFMKKIRFGLNTATHVFRQSLPFLPSISIHSSVGVLYMTETYC